MGGIEKLLEGKKWEEVKILSVTEDGDVVLAVAEGREGIYCPSLDFGRREMFCSCPGFRVHGTLCKHLAALLVSLRGRREERELEEAVGWSTRGG